MEQKNCPFYDGIKKDGQKHFIHCGNHRLQCSDPELKPERPSQFDTCTARNGSHWLDCRAFLIRAIQAKNTNVGSNHSIPELQEIWEAVKKRPSCAGCEFYWYSGGYTNAALYSHTGGYDGWKEWESRKIPCESMTHYCRPDTTTLHKITHEPLVFCSRQDGGAQQEDTQMENTTAVATTATQDITPEYQQAMELHYEILASGDAAVAALTSLFRNLKRMRDEQLYLHLGVESFKEYLEQRLNIESRQAYTYISVLDNLQPHLLQSNAGLGITKLALLTQVPALERESFLEDNDLEGMSTREVKELVEQLKKQGEQLSLLQEEKEQLQEDNRSLADQVEQAETVSWDEAQHRQELEKLQAELQELRSRPVDTEAQQPDEETVERIRQEAREAAEAEAAVKVREAQQQVKDAKKEALEKAQKAADKAVAAAREQAMKDAEERFQQSLAALEDEKSQAMTRALELEKQLKAAGNSDTVRFSVLFEEFQGNFTKIAGFIAEKKADDAEQGEKYQGALVKALDALKAKAEEL